MEKLFARGWMPIRRSDDDNESQDGRTTTGHFVVTRVGASWVPVLAGFHRILRPGGRVALFEYDHELIENSPEDMAASMRKINKYAAMPTNGRSHPGVFKGMLEEAGFVDIVVRDYSENIRPMARLFFILAIIPYIFVRLLGLERYFINTIAGVESYRGKGRWRYVAITASKPGEPLESPKTRSHLVLQTPDVEVQAIFALRVLVLEFRNKFPGQAGLAAAVLETDRLVRFGIGVAVVGGLLRGHEAESTERRVDERDAKSGHWRTSGAEGLMKPVLGRARWRGKARQLHLQSPSPICRVHTPSPTSSVTSIMILRSLLASLVATAHFSLSAPIEDVDILGPDDIELIPGPGLPSLESLGLTAAQIYNMTVAEHPYLTGTPTVNRRDVLPVIPRAPSAQFCSNEWHVNRLLTGVCETFLKTLNTTMCTVHNYTCTSMCQAQTKNRTSFVQVTGISTAPNPEVSNNPDPDNDPVNFPGLDTSSYCSDVALAVVDIRERCTDFVTGTDGNLIKGGMQYANGNGYFCVSLISEVDPYCHAP
ncbi:hypothetical protein B0T16DRAFT_444124 [Cercophora newfieldiana]|uniref:Methyltransferase type 11 domain-containing protein n=1 Tax=Cercophora newfieldiana TaxID=92897 RepID=A0AA40CWB9_9PEZI|nr:hypothetical protein B0T16DRAFT_444124 [Cercophora newfieldiana]